MNKKLLSSFILSAGILAAIPAKASADVGAALIIGGIIGAAAASQPAHQPDDRRHYEVYNGPYPVYRLPPPPVYHAPNPVYELIEVYDPACGCIRTTAIRVR